MAEILSDRGDSVPPSTCFGVSADLWGIRLAVGAIVLANLIAFGVIEGGYNRDVQITKFAAAGGFYLLALGAFLYRRLKHSPGDGVFVAIALSLVGSAANLSSHDDLVEACGAIAAVIVGPVGFLAYGVRWVRPRRSSEGFIGAGDARSP